MNIFPSYCIGRWQFFSFHLSWCSVFSSFKPDLHKPEWLIPSRTFICSSLWTRGCTSPKRLSFETPAGVKSFSIIPALAYRFHPARHGLKSNGSRNNVSCVAGSCMWFFNGHSAIIGFVHGKWRAIVIPRVLCYFSISSAYNPDFSHKLKWKKFLCSAKISSCQSQFITELRPLFGCSLSTFANFFVDLTLTPLLVRVTDTMVVSLKMPTMVAMFPFQILAWFTRAHRVWWFSLRSLYRSARYLFCFF